MMRHIYTLVLLLATSALFGQRMINQEVGEFSSIKVFDLIEVNLIQSDENRVVIKGENIDEVKVINMDGVLKLRMQLEKRFDGSRTFVEVYFTEIDMIDANEGAYIVVNEMINQNTMELRAQEGGRIKVGLKVNHVKTKAVTGGIVELSGLAESQQVTLNTGGIFEGRSLETKETDIKITAAGEAEVYASEKVKVRVTAGGDVDIYGNPQKVDKKSFAGGRISVRN